MAGTMQALRAVMSIGQRQNLRQMTVHSKCVQFSSSTVQSLSAEEWMENIRSSAKKDALVKRSKLASFLKAVKNSEELKASKEIMRIYEQKRVDPDANAAGLFVKKALEFNVPEIAFDVLEANYRIGLFLEPSTLNKLLSKFLTDREFDKVYTLYEIGHNKYNVRSTERTYDILVRAAIEEGDYEKAVSFFKTAAESQKLQRVTCNNLLFKLKDNAMQDKVEKVVALMKTAGVEPNETTKKILP
ncbi:F21B23.6 PROTEIN-RELATED [Plasmopara halstedii]|uniref:F21B23.6 PROTEIN-RELATED n=1 Tax=Plasmopara halstedii TaxID=4781 RepID=A0A0P1ACN0_PLAHL|nr:F21B23.6 PROTEIN-RELATED [Plasmopara halstedii]CEG38663.1 F21B23.6 PROTEIN-RELATED [Plasmopara halstedii]|eukprot:XP_024575032.1 F21B23.6 PROTEIN-RELATED [Plasmopara halstedii]